MQLPATALDSGSLAHQGPACYCPGERQPGQTAACTDACSCSCLPLPARAQEIGRLASQLLLLTATPACHPCLPLPRRVTAWPTRCLTLRASTSSRPSQACWHHTGGAMHGGSSSGSQVGQMCVWPAVTALEERCTEGHPRANR